MAMSKPARYGILKGSVVRTKVTIIKPVGVKASHFSMHAHTAFPFGVT